MKRLRRVLNKNRTKRRRPDNKEDTNLWARRPSQNQLFGGAKTSHCSGCFTVSVWPSSPCALTSTGGVLPPSCPSAVLMKSDYLLLKTNQIQNKLLRCQTDVRLQSDRDQSHHDRLFFTNQVTFQCLCGLKRVDCYSQRSWLTRRQPSGFHLILGTKTRSRTEFPKKHLQTRVHQFEWSEAATLPDVQLDFTCLKGLTLADFSGFTEMTWIKTFTSGFAPLTNNKPSWQSSPKWRKLPLAY